jgi:hypothetical protein
MLSIKDRVPTSPRRRHRASSARVLIMASRLQTNCEFHVLRVGIPDQAELFGRDSTLRSGSRC